MVGLGMQVSHWLYTSGLKICESYFLFPRHRKEAMLWSIDLKNCFDKMKTLKTALFNSKAKKKTKVDYAAFVGQI